MKLLIIEDEPLSAERLSKQLQQTGYPVEIIGFTDSIQSSVLWLKNNNPPDLIFMDIELADGQSFAIFKQTDVRCPVIFTTAYDEFTLQAFKVNSIDYLLKPIKAAELANSLHKFTQLQTHYLSVQLTNIKTLVSEIGQKTQSYRRRFLVKYGQRLVAVNTSDIAFFYVEGRLTFFKTWKGTKYSIDYSLDELQSLLMPEDFNRVNRAFIVHIKAIQQIHNYFGGKLLLDLSPATEREVLISKESAAGFRKWLGK